MASFMTFFFSFLTGSLLIEVARHQIKKKSGLHLFQDPNVKSKTNYFKHHSSQLPKMYTQQRDILRSLLLYPASRCRDEETTLTLGELMLQSNLSPARYHLSSSFSVTYRKDNIAFDHSSDSNGSI